MIKIRNFSIKLPYQENIKGYNLNLKTENPIKIKQRYATLRPGVTMPMNIGFKKNNP